MYKPQLGTSCMSEPSTTTSLLIVYIHIAAVSAQLDLDHCYLYMCHIHTMYTLHSLQLPSGAEYDMFLQSQLQHRK